MRILVTGANGYLGQGIVKAIIESGNKVIATDFKLDNVDTKESYVMGKMYALFVSEEVLEPSMDNEMILTGVGHNKGRRLDRTLGTLIKTDFAKKEIISEYMKIIDIIFCKLNIRNCIMHGLGETFDYLNIGIVAIMFQLLWDVAACEELERIKHNLAYDNNIVMV